MIETRGRSALFRLGAQEPRSKVAAPPHNRSRRRRPRLSSGKDIRASLGGVRQKNQGRIHDSPEAELAFRSLSAAPVRRKPQPQRETTSCLQGQQRADRRLGPRRAALVPPTTIRILARQDRRDERRTRIRRFRAIHTHTSTRSGLSYWIILRLRRRPRYRNRIRPAPIHSKFEIIDFYICSFLLWGTYLFTFFNIGTRNFKTCRTPGPPVTIIMAGRMQKKIGNTSFTLTFAARSSASCRRRTRMKSACVRRDSATLVPKRSACTSTATSFFSSGSPVLSARLCSASERLFPARISRFTSVNSSQMSLWVTRKSRLTVTNAWSRPMPPSTQTTIRSRASGSA